MVDPWQLPACDGDGNVYVVVEWPRDARVKLAYELELSTFTLSQPLTMGIEYPFNCGYVPSTRMPNGDPLDAVVLMNAPTYPGVLVACRALGVLRIDQCDRERRGARVHNERLIAVPARASCSNGVSDARQLAERLRVELAQFFLAVVALTDLTDKNARVLGWDGPVAAQALVTQGMAAFG
jgi:inorganic pyrophosphatase